ncbi:MAG: exodeoxyribonuclease VII small subunit [Firmicutes bacterium]|nr:exodeoxyribonuclease VII small subunit [Bacillota bacterium]
MEKENIKFEEAFLRLETAAKAVSDDRISLEEAIEKYKEGRDYYQICSRILDEAKQLIEIYDRENDIVKEME